MRKDSNVLFSKRSKYQQIELRRNRGGLLLKLNGCPQVHSNDERIYHESFATLPMMLAKKIRRVVILGGGDGLAAREVLRFPQVEHVTLVELDGDVVRLCSRNVEWRKLTRNSLNDPRLEVVVGDGLAWMMKTAHTFDVIIHDMEDEFTEQPQSLTVELYYKFYQTLYKKLNPGGIWVTTIEEEESDIMLNEMYKAFRHTLPRETQQAFARQRTYIGKNRVLLSIMFPWVKTLTVDLPQLGPHTHFYMSKTPISRVARKPKDACLHLSTSMFNRILGKTA